MRFSAILSILPSISLSIASVLPARDVCPKAPFHVSYIDQGSNGGKLARGLALGGLLGEVTATVSGITGELVCLVVDDLTNLSPLDRLDLHWDENSKHMYYVNDGQKKWAYFEKSGALGFAGKVPDGCQYWEYSCKSYDGYLYPGSGSKSWSACKAGDYWQLYDPRRAPASCKGDNLLSIKISVKLYL
ncbi:hypothetical protein RUND412_005473 [Rhizina undulata]